MIKLRTSAIFFGLCLLSVTLFLHLSLLVLSIPFLSISLLYFSGGLTKQYKEVYVYSITSYILLVIASVTMIILYAFDYINVLTISITMGIFLILLFIHFLMYKKIVNNNIIITPLITEITIISRFIPAASFFVLFPFIITNINSSLAGYLFSNTEFNHALFFLYAAGYILIWFLIVRRNIRFLLMNVKNATSKNISKFITITTVIPMIIHVLISLIYLILAKEDGQVSEFFILYSVAIIPQVVYLRNFSQELIKRISKVNPFEFTQDPNQTTDLPDYVIDADFTEI